VISEMGSRELDQVHELQEIKPSSVTRHLSEAEFRIWAERVRPSPMDLSASSTLFFQPYT